VSQRELLEAELRERAEYQDVAAMPRDVIAERMQPPGCGLLAYTPALVASVGQDPDQSAVLHFTLQDADGRMHRFRITRNGAGFLVDGLENFLDQSRSQGGAVENFRCGSAR
jgi:hypothetical protein